MSFRNVDQSVRELGVMIIFLSNIFVSRAQS